MIDGFWEEVIIELPLFTLVIGDDIGWRFVEQNYLYFRYFCPN